jgi:hypothetical protein
MKNEGGAMSSKKDIYRSRLSRVPSAKVFRLNDGKDLRNLEELAVALSDMNEQVFSHHVTEQKNDFSNWIKDVIGDSTLAKNLTKASERAQARQIVQDRVAWLKDRA